MSNSYRRAIENSSFGASHAKRARAEVTRNEREILSRKMREKRALISKKEQNKL